MRLFRALCPPAAEMRCRPGIYVLIVMTAYLAGCGGGPAGTPRSVTASVITRTPAVRAPVGSAPVTSPSPFPGRTATRVRYVFPVRASNVAFHPTHAKYPATDLFADCGEPVVATTSGVVLEVSLRDRYVEGSPDGPDNGGLSVSLLGDDGVRYYGSHLSRVLTGIRAGVRVVAGQELGRLGRTGHANGVCHLHYGISPPCARVGDWKVRRGVIWPVTYLRSWRDGGRKSPVAAVAAWERSHHCQA